MSYEKITLLHEHEDVVVEYCAKNDIQINIGNAYDVTLRAFKNNPALYISTDKITGIEEKIDVTTRVARLIEYQPRTIERIAARVELKKSEIEKETWRKNVEKSNIDSSPNIETLVDNLYRLNIVDKHSYLGLVCFLMQLKYSRDKEIPNDNKTCVFFNGVAQNGKSTTADAIREVEKQYGLVFEAKSGKVLEATHEIQVWTSHLNVFDEVKPTDVDRELLLVIINGGNVEVNPKNKNLVTVHVNTNNIFTSNDQISLNQRRVSVIKFGNRLSGRPLLTETLVGIITNIMNSLPSWEHYYDLYDVVSIHNQNRINPLALSNIITYITQKLGFVNHGSSGTLKTGHTFAPHDIYNCVKDRYSKQMIQSERKEAIRTALDYLVTQNLLSEKCYSDCTTRNYHVTGDNYIKIMEKYNNMNTKDEENFKISKSELYTALSPYFDNVPFPKNRKPEYKEPNMDWMKCFSEDKSPTTIGQEKLVTADIQQKGDMFLNVFWKHVQRFVYEDPDFEMAQSKGYNIDDVLERYITKELCENVSYRFLCKFLKLKSKYLFGRRQDKLIKNLYMHLLGLSDEKTLDESDAYKISYREKIENKGVIIDCACEDDITETDEKEHKIDVFPDEMPF